MTTAVVYPPTAVLLTKYLETLGDKNEFRRLNRPRPSAWYIPKFNTSFKSAEFAMAKIKQPWQDSAAQQKHNLSF